MAIALPIHLVAGDTGLYPCKITGARIDKGVLSINISLIDGYIFNNNCIMKDQDIMFDFSDYTDLLAEYNNSSNKLIINNIISSETPNNLVHNLNFCLPADLTRCFKDGKYTYDISVQEISESYTYTPIYTNAFNVYAKTNKIID